jgi:glycosyltransferase involved in cell wall biosynthesis
VNPLPITCIVPVYNGERFLGEALSSILEQTYWPLEILVVDDGSTDGTADVVARHAGRVTYLRQPSNRGSAAARNAGIAVARGAYVAFLDADDLWHREKLARQMARLRERPDIELCFTAFQSFWMPELGEEEHQYRDHPLSRPSFAWSIGTLLARRVMFEKYGPFDECFRRYENMLWFLRAAGRGAVIDVLQDVLMRRRFHLANDTRQGQGQHSELFLPIVKAWRDYRRWQRSGGRRGGIAPG